MFNPAEHFSTLKTPQTQPLPTAETPQVKMRSGGHGWQVDDWTLLDRFLILGSEGGTYYASERTVTVLGSEALLRCITEDGIRTVNRIVEISTEGRAPKNIPALFALAAACKIGSKETRTHAYSALQKVARIGTHLFLWAEYCKAFGGKGGSGYKKAITRWYTEKAADKLAYQVVKYKQREGWSHRDLLRLSHPTAPSPEHSIIFEYIVRGVQNGVPNMEEVPSALAIIGATELAKLCDDKRAMVKLIEDYKLPHECVPNDFKKHPEVWDALLLHMPPHAIVRNLNKMTAVGLLTGMSDATKLVINMLGSAARLARARMHPMSLLMALGVYSKGHGVKGTLGWQPVNHICDALSEAFYLAFPNVAPVNKPLVLGIDVSSSMNWGDVGNLTPRALAAAMALVTANTEPQYEMVAFTGGRGGVSRINISPKQRLNDALQIMDSLDFGPTDCAMPISWALENEIKCDGFITYTDNESWCGPTHVSQALDAYRNKTGRKTKFVACAFAANEYSVADPNDAGQMNVVGMDSGTPNVISDFLRG